MSSIHIGLRQFREGELLSYLLFDKGSKKAILIDPRLALVSDYREYIAEERLKLTSIINTHSIQGHEEDHNSINHLFKLNNNPIENSKICLEESEFKVLGGSAANSENSIMLWGEGLVFTGNSYLIASPDLAGKYSEILRELPKDTIIFPSFNKNDVLFSTIEKEFNKLILTTAHQQFISINIDKFKNKLEENSKDSLFIDVREPEEFRAGHIPGTRNVPLSELGLHLSEFSKRTRIYFSCQSGRRSLLAAKTLAYLGVSDIVNVVGGYQSWINSGYSSRK